MRYVHFIGIGSNLAARRHVPQAIHALLRMTSELTLSRVLETQAEGMLSNHPFLNAVVCLRTGLAGGELKGQLNEIEGQLGRDRSDLHRGVKDRPIDLDMLLSLPPGLNEICVDQVPSETYYRPQMLELVHTLAYSCRIPADNAGCPVEIEFSGGLIGSRPVQICCSGNIMRTQHAWQQ